ncbi:hypothetical protein FOZ62_002791, partial [Perkinsus olseni]
GVKIALWLSSREEKLVKPLGLRFKRIVQALAPDDADRFTIGFEGFANPGDEMFTVDMNDHFEADQKVVDASTRKAAAAQQRAAAAAATAETAGEPGKDATPKDESPAKWKWSSGSAALTMSSLPSTSNESLCGLDSSFTVILGTQWGDEGKGKLVDILAQRANLCARFNGGANAGHTLVVDDHKFAFHLLPCGIVNKKCDNLVGNGVVLHVPTLLKELEQLKDYDAEALKRLYLSNRASLLFDAHQMIDGIQEAEKNSTAIGTTKRGIGPCYANKTTRNGLRVGDLMDLPTFDRKLRELLEWCQLRYNIELDIESEVKRYHGYAEVLKSQIVDSVTMMHKAIQKSQR